MKTFEEAGLLDDVLNAIAELGFQTPTPIQEKTIPHMLSSDRDIIASAQTGTGKTAAFGLPIVQLTKREDKRTQTLILCPTRELCIQITKDMTNYSKYLKGLGIVPVYGGASIDTQLRALRKEAQVVVATPGRAMDLIKRKKLVLKNVERVVLDEADEMLSMGFKEDLEAILAETPEERQVLLFSATMPRAIMNITKKYMFDPIQLAVAKVDTAAANIKHMYYMVHAHDRYELLKRVADINPDIYGIVFCRTRRETKEVASKLMHDGYNADALHGELSQAQRDEVMGQFRNHRLQILVATDVAARGLDVNDLTHIINYNLPDDAEIYIHRSGRTGRAGKSGISIAIIHTREFSRIRVIEKRYKITFAKQTAPTGKDICTKQLYTLIDKIEKVKVDEQQIEPFLPAILKKLEWLSREDLIKHFVSAEFNRFLDYYKNARDINVSNSPKTQKKKSRNERRKTLFARLFINVGSVNGLNPTRLIGLINQALDSGDATVGSIEVMKKFAFFEVDAAVEMKLTKAMNEMTFDGVSLAVEASQAKPPGATKSTEWPPKKKRGYPKRDSRSGDRKKRSSGGRRNRRK
ncbi:MAG: DEAD/DEAH box helicase [Candidatus Marinimicrobia bacterium]|nr:DEAD/DEAH box helicase [Candidatus Neomarinimicrobiota bacterium]